MNRAALLFLFLPMHCSSLDNGGDIFRTINIEQSLPFLNCLGGISGPILSVVDDVADLHVEAPVLIVQVVPGGLRYLVIMLCLTWS